MDDIIRYGASFFVCLRFDLMHGDHEWHFNIEKPETKFQKLTDYSRPLWSTLPSDDLINHTHTVYIYIPPTVYRPTGFDYIVKPLPLSTRLLFPDHLPYLDY